jgi:hypothetical protein
MVDGQEHKAHDFNLAGEDVHLVTQAASQPKAVNLSLTSVV